VVLTVGELVDRIICEFTDCSPWWIVMMSCSTERINYFRIGSLTVKNNRIGSLAKSLTSELNWSQNWSPSRQRMWRSVGARAADGGWDRSTILTDRARRRRTGEEMFCVGDVNSIPLVAWIHELRWVGGSLSWKIPGESPSWHGRIGRAREVAIFRFLRV
jgi:hypothetical protein